MTSSGGTALMPIDPAMSAQQVSRVLPIRANLLPPEITAGRNARRIRYMLVGTALLVVLLLGLWFLYAANEKRNAEKDLAAATDQVDAARKSQRKYDELTTMIKNQETASNQLSTLLANDLPWAKMLDTVRNAGIGIDVEITELTGSFTADDNPAAASDAVATLAISGMAPDKKTTAKFVEKLATLHGIANPYLTSANETKDGVQFTLTAEITKDALCGRYTKPCKTGGN